MLGGNGGTGIMDAEAGPAMYTVQMNADSTIFSGILYRVIQQYDGQTTELDLVAQNCNIGFYFIR